MYIFLNQGSFTLVLTLTESNLISSTTGYDSNLKQLIIYRVDQYLIRKKESLAQLQKTIFQLCPFRVFKFCCCRAAIEL